MAGYGSTAKRSKLPVSRATGTRAPSGEFKVWDITTGELSDLEPGRTLINIEQGTDDKQRIGRSIRVHSISIRWKFQTEYPTDIQPSFNYVRARVLVVLDRQPNGVQAGYEDVIEGGNIDGFPSMENSRRFAILMDDSRLLNSTCRTALGAAGRGQDVQHSCWRHKRCSIPVEYMDSTNDVTSIMTNNIFVCAKMFPIESEADAPEIAFSSRIKFTD